MTDIAGQIVKYGHVVNSHRAFLGVELATGLSRGAVVVAVTRGGPAARAGIKPGDQIAAIAGQPISAAPDVAEVLATLHPGQSVRVVVTHQDGSHGTTQVRLGEYPGASGG